MLENLTIAAVFALIHMTARRLTFLSITPRSVWLSIAGGVSVAYVFLHLLPELHEGQRVLHEGVDLRLSTSQVEIYLVTLAGLVVFYGLERLAAASRAGRRKAERGDFTGAGAFALHIGSFAIYNALIGYLLVRGERPDMLLYACAMGLHYCAYEFQTDWWLNGGRRTLLTSKQPHPTTVSTSILRAAHFH